MSPRPIEPPRSAFESALAMARAGRCPEAVRWVDEACGPEPDAQRLADAARTLAQIGRLAAALGDRVAALSALDLAAGLRPAWADLHLGRALACAALERRADARAALDEALRLNPRYLAARLERALLDAREGFVGEALSAVRALADDARVDDARAFAGGLESLERADWDEAAVMLRRALRVAEPDLEQRLERFEALLEEGRPREAADLLREVMRRYEAYPDLHHRLGVAELREGLFDDALVSLGRALELNPDFSAARLLLARALDATGARAQALEQLAMVLEREPANRQARALESEWSARPTRAQAGRKGT
jgi:tetratricopeptide (TPR) repeat protein